MKKKSSVLTFQDWKSLKKESFKAFPSVFWRIAGINLFVMIFMFLGAGLLSGITLLIFENHETLENIIANIRMGGYVEAGSIFGLTTLFFFFFLWVLLFSILGKIGNILVMKNLVGKKLKNPFTTYFVDTWKYLGRYVFLGLKILWYVGWPLLIVLIFLGIIPYFLKIDFYYEVFGILVAGVLIWRIVYILLAPQILIHFGKNTKKSFNSAIELVKGDWWSVAFYTVAFLVLISIPRLLFWGPQILTESGLLSPNENILGIFSLIDFCYSFFILVPLLVSFLYFLMLHLVKVKKIKI